MASENKNERPAKDLSVPETMKIAALLAELMPTAPAGAKPATLRPTDSLDDIGGGNLSTPALSIDDLDDMEPVAPAAAAPPKVADAGSKVVETPPKIEAPRQPPAPKIIATVTPGPGSKPLSKVDAPKVVAPKMEASPALPPTPVPPPLHTKAAAPSDESAGSHMGRYNWNKARDVKAPEAPKPPVAAHDPELIPVGGLAAASFFGLVNWKNEPARARQPRRADFGLDEQTLAVARQNPFYVLGQPRRAERETVAEVLAEIKW